MDSLNTFSQMPSSRPEDDNTDNDDLYQSQQADRDNSFHDAYHLYFLLRQRLNADIARIIMQEMDLHEIYRQKRQLDNMSAMQLNCPVPCFIGSAIQARARIQRPVRKVIFRFESHDQGWTSSRDQGSWSWFEVGVVPDIVIKQHEIVGTEHAMSHFVHPDFKPVPQSVHRTMHTIRAPRLHRPVPQATEPIEPVDDSQREYSRTHPINDQILREQEVFRNSLACRDWEVNTVVWSHDDPDPVKASWVQSLQIGDHIIVRAWARFPGWANYVRTVSVTVCNAIFA